MTEVLVVVSSILNTLNAILTTLQKVMGKRCCIVDYGLSPLTPYLLSNEERHVYGCKSVWGIPLLITIKVSAGCKCRGRCVVRPLVKRRRTWIQYAPLISPELVFFSWQEFQPIYIETDFERFVQLIGVWGESRTSAVAFRGEKAKLMIEFIPSDESCKGKRKFFDIWKILKKARSSIKEFAIPTGTRQS